MMHKSPLKADFHSREPQLPGKPFTLFRTLGAAWPDNELMEHVRPMERDTLANILNYLHFSDSSLLVHIQENGNPNGSLLPVYPEPCLDGKIRCRWAEPGLPNDIEEKLRNLVIDDGRSLVVVPAEVTERHGRSFVCRLPEESWVLTRREEKRYPCRGISVEIRTAKGGTIRGKIIDFSPTAFRVSLDRTDSIDKHFDLSGETVGIRLTLGGKPCFSGTCACQRVGAVSEDLHAVFLASDHDVPVFEPRKVRNPRIRLSPPPSIRFRHPLLQKQMQMEIHDLCTSGFSVHEDAHNCLLVPGLVIPALKLHYAGNTVMTCSAQVVYRKEAQNGQLCCGVAIVDTSIEDYTRLNQILENGLDSCAFVSCEIDPEALWEFFFSTGFVYPEKYKSISSSKDQFKENCKRLYKDNSAILQHFVYQKGGSIYGYHSIVWAYNHTWLIHHHAGRSLGNKMGGLMVLRETMHYLTDMHRFRSSPMKYAMTYFRPENRFPNLVFGRFAKRMKNPKACSVDSFSYFSVGNRFLDVRLPESWTLKPLTESDKDALREFYETHSGGLLLKAFSLEAGGNANEELEALYARHGLLRRMSVYGLKHGQRLAAVLIADRSDRGLNLSELLNCIKVVVLDSEGLPWQILHRAVSHFATGYGMEEIPVMCYPSEYTQKKGISCEKTYRMWILSVEYGDAFMEYMHDRLRIC